MDVSPRSNRRIPKMPRLSRWRSIWRSGKIADLVVATDPDCDRMGVAVRDATGALELLTGNQIGSLMAWYRVMKLREQGVITPENAHRCVIIKTLVTTDLQKAIAEKNGLRCVETLTGFKYIGEKLGKYENALPPESREDYRTLAESETRAPPSARFEFLCLRWRRKLRLQRRGFCAGQGWQRRRGGLCGSRRLRKVAGPDDRGVARRDLRGIRFLLREERHADFRRRGGRRANSGAGRLLWR